ncbi:hypothetical protein [Planctomyces sp. SH-PL62]|uniref:hypothetical protein n=1 Tax=Planctomyces sp. SH-PL62 TaxID=1636152 RepID=UPI00078B4F5D|nr:hypothetical protein [Planctomyces sp. SH-PL62]AMV40055.1 hypothetical protein VT85_21655 [Planctomyces sp. SH-PL62]
MSRTLRSIRATAIGILLGLGFATTGFADSGVQVDEAEGLVRVTWTISPDESGSAVFSLDPEKPLIESLGVATDGEAAKPVATGLNPVTFLTVGSRDLKNPAGWVAFFDNPPKRPHQTFPIVLGKRRAIVSRDGARTTVSVAEAAAGSFRGDVRFTFHRNSPLIQAETVVATEEDGRAIVYDTGFAGANSGWDAIAWNEAAGPFKKVAFDPDSPATPLAVSGRAVAAESGGGSLAVFPEPHRYFYPLDEAFNLKFVWHGRDYGGAAQGYGIGVRQELTGDRRFVPWFNAPAGTEQHLGVFLLLTRGDGRRALDAVAKYTRGDRYKALAGHKTFTSHYHVEHTLEYLRRQKEQGISGQPRELETPGMVETFKARGVDIVHLAEFHVGETPRLGDAERLPQLKLLHEECARLSEKGVLILPGEEPNVHLGGHWISFFPNPVYWVLNRREGQPFVEDVEGYGTVYRVGSAEDVLRLMEREDGLMWTAHPRIKSSIGFPDGYKDRDFFRSEHFLGAAWKAMPADLSRPTLGWRVLDLLDDMENWRARKQIVGEADLFRMEPDFETYAHMNINYLKLDATPRFADGWKPVLDALRGGRYFTTTGEVLIPDFTVGGKPSGQDLGPIGEGETVVEASLEWTFPMAFAEVVSGDGRNVFRHRIDLADAGEFGSRKLRIPLDLKGRTWVRFEAWDVAGDGAFTQTVRLTAGEARPDGPAR